MSVHSRHSRASYVPRRPEFTLLHEVVSQEFPRFLDHAESRGRRLPLFIEKTLAEYLTCGDPAKGFIRLRCNDCGFERALAFSCKRRGVCPSCNGRRMAETAADLVEFVLPHVGVRQWVLTLPFALRYRLAYDRSLLGPVLAAFQRALFRSITERVYQWHAVRNAKCGAVTFVQRFGGALNLNVHFHVLALEGAYEVPPAAARVNFLRLPAPTADEVRSVLADAAIRIARCLRRVGLGPERDPDEADRLAKDDPLLARLYQASLEGRVALGERAGHATARDGRPEPRRPNDGPTVPLCAVGGGMSLHAGVYIPGTDRERLERVCRYTGRPPLD